MKVMGKLASSLGRRDEEPNVALAAEIAKMKDRAAVKELIEGLADKNKDIQSDCIKVIYEIAALDPKLVSGYYEDLVSLLDNKNNRLQWGGMTALNAIALEKPDIVFKALPKLVAVAEKGSVITRDHLMGILIKLASVPKYADDSFALFNEQLMTSPSNQVPMYAENALPIITGKNKATFLKTLTSRLDDFEKESKKKRVEKVIKKLQGK